jgi:hypothetical protein
MGILDEAIRDHLELKRQHGANRDELKRLEDEAFGPPSRPGEPDFPPAGPSTAQAEQPARADAEAATAEAEPPTTVVGAPEADTLSEPAPPPEHEPAMDGGAEPAAEEHRVLGEEAASPATPYDHSLEDDLDLGELDLELEEPADTATSPTSPPTEPTAAPPPAPQEEPAEPPVESLETVEHPFEPGIGEDELESEEVRLDEPAVEELELEHPADEPPPGEPAATQEGEPESDEDDVLADTPDFLRDAPEDDELWFEQGEPKDFDFD